MAMNDGLLKVAGYAQPLTALNWWITAVRTIPEGMRVVESRGRVQVLGRVCDGCYVLLCPDDDADTSWVLPAVVADAGGPDDDLWSFACESFGDVLVTYFFVG